MDWSVAGVNEWLVTMVLPNNLMMLHNDIYHIAYRDVDKPSLLVFSEPTSKRCKTEPSDACAVELRKERVDALRATMYKVHSHSCVFCPFFHASPPFLFANV